jgi:hypothetical protein
VTLDATKAATITMHPSTLSTIVEIKEGNENLQPEWIIAQQLVKL